VQFRATGSSQSGDGINDEFRLVAEHELSNNVYWLRGRDGAVLTLNVTGTLEPGRYLMRNILTVNGAMSGSIDSQFEPLP
jgi:hypothetical protein